MVNGKLKKKQKEKRKNELWINGILEYVWSVVNMLNLIYINKIKPCLIDADKND